MGEFSYYDIFATKGMDYLIAIVFVLSLIALWKWLNRSGRTASRKAGWGSAILSAAAVSCVLIVVLLHSGGPAQPEARTMNVAITTPPSYGFDLAAVPDGTFRGESHYGSYTCQVDVVVKGHTIKHISLIDREPTPVDSEIVKRILEQQTPYVCTVPGATIASKTLLRAVENALLATL